MENKNGTITVGFGTPEQKELAIVEYVQAEYKNCRLITVSEIEDGSICCVVENPKSTGRHEQAKIWLSKESFIGMVTTAMLFMNCKGEDFEQAIKEATGGEAIRYRFSDGLKKVDIALNETP